MDKRCGAESAIENGDKLICQMFEFHAGVHRMILHVGTQVSGVPYAMIIEWSSQP